MAKLKIGYAPTRREGFSVQAALQYKSLIWEKLQEFDADFINIDDVNEYGMLDSEESALKAVNLFRENMVDAVFFTHCNFGTEFAQGRVGKELNKPVLLWAPQDERPAPHAVRTRDAQCGLFAAGKVFRRFNVPFTYLTSCKAEDQKFMFGMDTFLAATRVVKSFNECRILQIAPRPQAFWSVICNEGELLEQFGIEVVTITLSELVAKTKEILESGGDDYNETLEYMEQFNTSPLGDTQSVKMIAALKSAMKLFCYQNSCTAVALQCWNALQKEVGLVPCFANGLLTDEGIPVVCETDIHGAVSAVIMQAAVNETAFFADMTIRHPDNPNAELLWHCGNFPPSLARNKKEVSAGKHVLMNPCYPGVGEFELKQGNVTICRFDGDHGRYSLFIGEGKTVEGPSTHGTYVWVEVDDLNGWEYKLVTGPYIHHCSVGYGRTAHVLYEACRYIPYLKADPSNPTDREILLRLIHGSIIE